MARYLVWQVDGNGQWQQIAVKPTEASAERAAIHAEREHRRIYGQHLTHIATNRKVGTTRITEPDTACKRVGGTEPRR